MRYFFHDEHLQSNPYVNFLQLFLVLVFLWVALSQIFEFQFLLEGIASCFFITLFCLRSFRFGGLRTENTYFLLDVHLGRFFTYFLWLVKEILKSAWNVTRIILFHREEIRPQVIWFRADYDNPVARALLANSITLTPGTVTIDIYDDGVFSVHALDAASAAGLLEGTMQRKVAQVLGEDIDYTVVRVKDAETETVHRVSLVSERYRRKKR